MEANNDTVMDYYTPTKETQMEVRLTLPMMEDSKAPRINAEISAKVTEVKMEYNNDTLLETAIALWEDTEEIPLDIEVELLGRGYDVAGLRKLHQTF